ncbi:MAG TPA: glycoside hydrolase family 15 protein [Polyangiaceae bacterium]
MRGFVPYPPIGRHGVIGDRRTAALVSGDGTIDWLCLRDYDDDPVFACLLDAGAGGWWRVGPERLGFGRQGYVDGTAVLTTTWSEADGELELTDAMPWPEERRHPRDEPRRAVVRRLRCVAGTASCTMHFAPRDMMVADLRLARGDGGVSAHLFGRRDIPSLGLWSTHELRIDPDGTRATARFRLAAGESAWFVLAVDERPDAWSVRAAEDALRATLDAWRHWLARFELRGPHARALGRSLVTIHLLGYAPTGAAVAAPTLGLPERLGGGRNYDYRHAWIRDASLSASGLSSMGDVDTAERYLGWLARLRGADGAPLQVAYDVHGCTRIAQRRWHGISGYRGSRPVWLGNHAYRQRQIGSLGYVADCMCIALDHGLRWRPEYASLLARMAHHTVLVWQEPDSGIWELRKHQQFVASKVMAWVVLDRAAEIAERCRGLDSCDVGALRANARDVSDAVLANGYDDRLGAFVQRYGHRSVDAAALLVPITGLLPPRDPRVLSTLDVIEEQLGFDGFVYRYVPEASVGEGSLPVGQFEGAFVPCSFWMAAARAMAGDVERAEAIVERVERATGELGLMAEEIDPRSGEWLGNYPQLFSHVEHVRALVAIARASAHHAPG